MLRIYACGGTGINQAASIADTELGKYVAYADCSNSDVAYHKAINQDNVFRFTNVTRREEDDVDGSGKRRDENFALIKPQMPKFFDQFTPAKFNVVLCSDAGGTGAVIAHLIVKKLLEEKLPVVLMVTNSVGSLKEASNAVKAMKGFNTLGANTNRAIPTVYASNSANDSTPSKADSYVANALNYIAALLTRDYHSLDTQDLYNFFSPQDTVNVRGGLIDLAYRSGSEIDTETPPLSMVSIVPNLDDLPKGVTAEYGAVGIDESLEQPAHFMLFPEAIGPKIAYVVNRRDELMQQSQNRTKVEDPFANVSIDGEDGEDDCIL